MINPVASRTPEPGERIGAWEVVRLLGRGGMALVYEVRRAEEATVGGDDVEAPAPPAGENLRGALKLVHGGGKREEADSRFRREHRALSRLQHTNVVRVYDTGTWRERPWYVMELLDGHDLKVEVEGWEVAPPSDRWSRVRRLATDLARALQYIHAAGLVHRDLTPGNVMVRPDGGATLMDFGVAKEAVPLQAEEEELTSHGELLGTVAWIAPEQIAGDDVDARADLYALGALMYYMLTGRRPFHARTLAGYLDKHLHRPPRPPREIVPDVPQELEEVVLRLLQKDPRDRYSSAAHLLQVLEGPVTTPIDLTRWPAETVGRGAQLAALLSAVASCAEGRGGIAVIEGAAGLGRTRLLRGALGATAPLGLRTHTLSARGSRGALEPFRSLVEALLAETGQRHPVLDALLGARRDSVTIERFAAFAAVRSLLAGSGPRVIAFDDVHLLDEASLELLEYLVRTTRTLADEPVLWLLTRAVRENDEALQGLLTGSSTGVKPAVVHLEPLTPSAVEELIGTLVPPDAAVRALARRLHRDGEGNPSFIVEMVRGLVEERVIRTQGMHRLLALDEAAVARAVLPVPQTARDALVARMAALTPPARTLLCTLAVARQELSLDALGLVLEVPDADLLTAVDELVQAELVRERRVEAAVHVDVAHVRTRDVIYREIAPAERTQRHRRIGEALERLGRRKLHLVLDALALHFELGESPSKAYSYLVRAGSRLMDRSFIREALHAFDRAVAIEPDVRELLPLDDADRGLCELLIKRAEALEHFANWELLDADLARARILATEVNDDRLLGRVSAALGRRARQAGDMAGAESHFQAAMAHVDRAGDHALRGFVMNQLGVVRWSRGDLEGARQHWIEGLAIAEGARDDRSIAYGYNGLGMVAACKGQAAEARRNFEQAAAVFERVGLLAPLAWVRGNLVEVHLLTGNLRRGLELAERTVVQARELNHSRGIVLARASLADVLTHLGRAEQGRAEAQAALELARQTHDAAECFTALIPLMRSLWALGETSLLVPLVEEALVLAREHDHEGFTGIVHAWRARLWAAQNDADAARQELALALDAGGQRWPYMEVRFDLALSRTFAILGDRPEAWRRADAAIRRSEACGYRLYALKGHLLAAATGSDEAGVARHARVADALGKALAANLAPPDAERFLAGEWLRS